MSKKSPSTPTTRRKFLTGAAVATAATVAAPSVVRAQGPINMRWQSTWPSKDIFHEYALDYAKKVNDMTGGEPEDCGRGQRPGRLVARPACQADFGPMVAFTAPGAVPLKSCRTRRMRL